MKTRPFTCRCGEKKKTLILRTFDFFPILRVYFLINSFQQLFDHKSVTTKLFLLLLLVWLLFIVWGESFRFLKRKVSASRDMSATPIESALVEQNRKPVVRLGLVPAMIESR
jgi:hypothetical protein